MWLFDCLVIKWLHVIVIIITGWSPTLSSHQL